MGTLAHSEHIRAQYQCLDCGSPTSTEKTVRCWDCSLKVKKANWRNSAATRVNEIMSKRDAGMTMVEIAADLGISRQRVYQLVAAAGRTVRPNPEVFRAKMLRKGE